MENIHNPSIPSTSRQTSGHDSSKAGEYERLLELMEEKARVEKELDALGSVLESVWFCGHPVWSCALLQRALWS